MTSPQPTCLESVEAGQMIQGVRRYESLFGRLVPVLDASEFTRERSTHTAPDLRLFRLLDVFSEGSLFIGFGRPNVFLGLPRKGGGFDKFDAKSLMREASKIVDTRGWSQSGMLLHIQPEPGMQERLLNASYRYSGTRAWTCVNANCRVLDEAGFTSAGKTLRQFYFPMAMAEQIIRHGLEYDGKPIGFEVVKTTPEYLENFGLSVIKAQFMTLCRHSSRWLEKQFRALPFQPALKKTANKNPVEVKERSPQTIREPLTFVVEQQPQSGQTIERVLSISEPSALGAVLRVFWGAHALFQLKPMTVDVNQYLPDRLKEFSAPNQSWFSKLKQYVLFSRPVVRFLRSHLMRSNLVIENCPQHEIFEMMRTHSNQMPNKYNIVITGESIGVVRINVKYPQVDWVLSKHVLTAGYSDDVRFAGEMWKGRDGMIYINNDSGTYQPSSTDVHNATAYLGKVFPMVSFCVIATNLEKVSHGSFTDRLK